MFFVLEPDADTIGHHYPLTFENYSDATRYAREIQEIVGGMSIVLNTREFDAEALRHLGF